MRVELTQETPIGFETRRTQCRSAAAVMRVAPHVGPDVRKDQEAGPRQIRNFHIYASALGILSVVRHALLNAASGAGSLERRGLAWRIFGSNARRARTEGVGDDVQPVSRPEIARIDFHASAGGARTTAQPKRHHLEAPSPSVARKEFQES